MTTVLGLAMALGVAAVGAGGFDLETLPDTYAYDATALANIGHLRTPHVYRGETVILHDVDGDGWDDFLTSRTGYVTAGTYHPGGSVTYFQRNLPPEFAETASDVSPFALKIVRGLTAPDRDDLVVWGSTQDGGRWRFWLLDPADGATRSEFEFAGGEDVYADGRWDGHYFAIGAIDVPTSGGRVRALVVGCNVGRDKYGRAVFAVDPRDGSVLWRYGLGPNAFPANTIVTDLEGDGREEIVLTARSPGNLHGELINGTSDDLTRLLVLDPAGRLRWDRVLGSAFGNAELALADMTGDGRLEIVTAARRTPDLRGDLVVWSAAGDTLAAYADTLQYQGVRTVQRRDRRHPSVLLVANRFLLEFDFDGAALTPRRTVRFGSPVHLNLVADVLPDRGVEAVVTLFNGPTVILDRELRPRLRADTEGGWVCEGEVWRPTPQTTAIVLPGTGRPPFLIAKAPFSLARLKPYALVFAGLLIGASAWLLARRHGDRRSAVDPRLLRETQLHLLENLELSSHGAIAPLKSVRRLVWNLRALQAEEVRNDRLEARIRETWADCVESALPLLRGIVERARLTGLAPTIVADIAAATSELDRQLQALPYDGFAAARRPGIADGLERAEGQAGRALLHLRGEISATFRADVADTVQRVFRANESALVAARVAFAQGAVAAAADTSAPVPSTPRPTALCDPREFEYVLDNLVANAINAMANAPRRELRITWRTTDGVILVDVSDTGRGLPRDTWERALNTHYTSKDAGGAGLPTSRKYLRKYGGTLSIMQSAPDQGTTFRITIPRI